jgi:hypothetical protein
MSHWTRREFIKAAGAGLVASVAPFLAPRPVLPISGFESIPISANVAIKRMYVLIAMSHLF